eukprot:CAMPEP_0171272738 /NCGR_PEP_ID=MMETSP0790-20130122/61919_1 /TAXON_ID=2925 /ORGANISM="Alexandrium catenella, Strain OF101" /LENGTH=80 /DNA_ID=CAMNT_0011741695 /DNA_START=86 /DNA_END=325 /DNA_ORIENTATION=-
MIRLAGIFLLALVPAGQCLRGQPHDRVLQRHGIGHGQQHVVNDPALCAGGAGGAGQPPAAEPCPALPAELPPAKPAPGGG